MSDVAVIGPGRVGTAVALGLARAGHRVVAVAGGAGGSAEALAGRLAGLRRHDDPTAAAAAAQLVVVTTPDDAIAEVVTTVAVADSWRTDHRVVHCSGAHGLDVLRRAALAGARVAACHPAQTVPADAAPDVLVGASWAVTAATADRGWSHELVRDLGGDPFDLAPGARPLYHAGLALGANGAGAAVAAARQLLLAAGVPHADRVLRPLVAASTANVLRDGAAALTGPVVRGDLGTVERHLATLDADLPERAASYRALQGVVLDLVAASLDADVAARLVRALAAPPSDVPPPIDVPPPTAR